MRQKLAWACVAVAVLVLAGDRLITVLLPPRVAGVFTFRAVAQVCLLLVVGLSAATLIARRLTRDLRHLAGVAAELRRGQLNAAARVRGRDEVAQLAAALNEMAGALRHTALETQSRATEVAETAHGLSLGGRDLDTAGGEIVRAARGIARGAERQVEALQRTSGVTRALATALREMAGRAVQAHATAGRAHDRAIGGADAAGRAAADLTAIAAAAEHASSLAESFADSSRQIHGAVDFILDLAQQTQILALNAALEAARAGDEGRGFAALAEEIRALADRTQTFGSRVQDRVRALDAGVAGLLRGMAATTSAAQSGRATAETARQTLEDLGRTLRAVEAAIEEIRSQTEAQTEGAQILMTSIEDIARIAGEHAAGTEETSAAVARQNASTRELTRSATRLAATARALRERTVLLGSAEPPPTPLAVEARA